MFSSKSNLRDVVETFSIDQPMRYSLFIPRLYNLCLSLGFEAGKIMPSRAFCSDENQGFPIILIAKHFGTFPFNHGRVGGIVATGRHGPHAYHGRDMVIIQASHVGFDPDNRSFGLYRRIQTEDQAYSSTCGKIDQIIAWYREEYDFARRNITLGRDDRQHTVTIDNHIMRDSRTEGLFLNLDKLVKCKDGEPRFLQSRSTSRVYEASDQLLQSLPAEHWDNQSSTPIGDYLTADMFHYRREITSPEQGHNQLEQNLISPMPWIITAEQPMLVAAQVNTQIEFDRAYRTIVRSPDYRGKNLLFISCLNIDVSPQDGQIFPLTKCVPWAAYLQLEDGSSKTLEQAEIVDLLLQQSSENPDQIDLEAAISKMIEAEEIRL